jgi:hypothetical protein
MSRFCLGNADPTVRTNFEPIRFADNPACPRAGSDVGARLEGPKRRSMAREWRWEFP